MEIRELFEQQYAQQREIAGALPESRAARRQMARDYVVAGQAELIGYLQAVNYKDLFDAIEAPRSNRLMELVDAFKYLLAAAWTEELSAEEFEAMFKTKTRTVSERWQQHQLADRRIVSFDMDGVLCDFGVSWGPTEQEFAERGGVLEIPPLPGAAETLYWLKDLGYAIAVTTARKRHIIERLDHDTREWLRRNDMPYDCVLYGQDKAQTIKAAGFRPVFHVDDSIKHALDVVDVVGRSFLFGVQSDTLVIGGYELYGVTDHADLRQYIGRYFDEFGA